MRTTNMLMIAIGAMSITLMGQRSLSGTDVHVLGTEASTATIPVAGWARQDPADAIWRLGREAINESDWSRAAAQFRRIRTESGFRSSTYRPQSYYWEAYARAQMGGSAQLRQAQDILEAMQEDFPEDARKMRDVAALQTSIEGRLSRDFGDMQATANLVESANKLAESAGRMGESVARIAESALGSALANSQRAANGCPDPDDDDNPRVAALNALIQMDSEAAMPILEQLLARREKCAEVLRAKAIWLIAQKRSPRAADILIATARNDPDPEVRAQAVFWLSQVDSDKAIPALEEILRSEKDAELHENALVALSQSRGERAATILRDFIARKDISSDLRGMAILLLGQRRGADNFAFLKDVYASATDAETKEQIMLAAAQSNNDASAEWVMSIAMNSREDIEIRKQALFHYAQSGAARGRGRAPGASADAAQKLIRLYDSMTDVEMKEQLIFVYGQRGGETVFIDKLMDIARNEKNVELRKNAIFWLGNVGSKDPRVAKFLMDLING
jgi:hypothetical protein